MQRLKNRAAFGLLVLGSLIPLTFAGSVVAAGPPAVGLGTADSYGVLAGGSIANTGSTTINGDLGLYPGASVSGAPVVINGTSNVNNGAAQQAKADARTAYLDAEGRSGPNLVAAGALGGLSLSPGLYKDDGAPASLGIASGQTLTLQGDASSVWIFQSASTLIAETGSRVVLAGGALGCNVFWQVGSAATLRTGSTFVGTVMAHDDITLENSVTVNGRMLAGSQANGAGALVMDTDTITRSHCVTAAEAAAAAAAQAEADRVEAERVASEALATEAANRPPLRKRPRQGGCGKGCQGQGDEGSRGKESSRGKEGRCGEAGCCAESPRQQCPQSCGPADGGLDQHTRSGPAACEPTRLHRLERTCSSTSDRL